MGKSIIQVSMYPEIVDVYNTEGKSAAFDLLRTQYGLKRPGAVISRIKEPGMYVYDANEDRFMPPQKSPEDDVFMSLDQLCQPAVEVCTRGSSTPPTVDSRPEAMERLVNELINDRLLTMSKYIRLDTLSKTVLIDHTSLNNDGYQVISH